MVGQRKCAKGFSRCAYRVSGIKSIVFIDLMPVVPSSGPCKNMIRGRKRRSNPMLAAYARLVGGVRFLSGGSGVVRGTRRDDLGKIWFGDGIEVGLAFG